MDQNPPEMENPREDPLVKEGIELARALKSGTITEEEFGNAYAAAVKKAKSIDAMTGLHSKTWMEEELETALSHAKRHNEPLSVLFIDGDKFKEINDHMNGHHDDGNTAIKAMAEAIKHAAKRSTDLKARLQEGESMQAGRQGGDEFVVILEGVNLYQASEMAREIQMLITSTASGALKGNYEKTFGHPFTASVGIAQYDPAIDKNGTDLLKRADQNLSQVRDEQGRNRRG